MSEKRQILPPRPHIPVALYLLIGVVMMQRAVLGCSLSWQLTLGLFAGLLAVGVVALLIARHLGRACKAWQTALCALAVVGACALSACLAGSRADAAHDRLASNPVSTFEFQISQDMGHSSSAWTARARVIADGGTLGYVWLSNKDQLNIGETITCVGRFTDLGDDEWGRTLRLQGVCGSVSVVKVTSKVPSTSTLLKLRERLLERIDPTASTGRAIAAGALCGYSKAVKELGIDNQFAVCGISHLIAVSGSHLSLISLFIAALLDKTRLNRWAKLGLTLIFTGFFVLFCGAPASACRAWLMSLCAAGSHLVFRRADPASAVSVCALLMVAFDPTSSGQIGFLLSVSCVVGLCLFSSYARYALFELVPEPQLRCFPYKLRKALGRARRSVLESFALCLVATTVSAPISLSTFGRLSLVAPLASVVLTPLFTVQMAVGAAYLGFVGFPVLGSALGFAVDALGSLFGFLLNRISTMPFASRSVTVDLGIGFLVLILLLGVLYVLWPCINRKAVYLACLAPVLAVTLHVARWRFFAPARICVLDVGQGDAILITDKSAAVLIDTGPGEAIQQALQNENVYHLDAVILTHLHDDHAGGLDDLVGTVPCDQVFVGFNAIESLSADIARQIADLTHKEAGQLNYQDTVRVGGFSLKLVSPSTYVSADENAGSLEFIVSYADGEKTLSGLLTGDAERDETSAVVETQGLSDIDFLKVGHHGSAISIDEESAQTLSPVVSVASAGQDNRYGHPKQECVDILEGAGSRFLCTKDSGDVTVEPSEKGVVVSTGK